jgi:rhamnosyltransferase
MNETQLRDPQKIHGIIVTFKPNSTVLLKLVTAVRSQVANVVIVNNGLAEDLPDLSSEENVTVHSLGDNLGLALAQNIGIAKAMAGGASHILLLDQDSLPDANMVKNLMHAMRELQRNNAKVAAVGPSYLDNRQGEKAPFVYREGTALKNRVQYEGNEIVEADFLIASGSLIPNETITAVGMMEEQLFIDYVDIEWGLRARREGYLCYGSFIAVMHHSLGDEWLELNGKKLPVHSPLRHYYQFRNAIWLARREWIGPSWRRLLLTRLIKQGLVWMMFLPNRPARLKAICLAVLHGFSGKMGKF